MDWKNGNNEIVKSRGACTGPFGKKAFFVKYNRIVEPQRPVQQARRRNNGEDKLDTVHFVSLKRTD